jgi:dihydroorotase
VVLERGPCRAPERLAAGGVEIVPFHAGEELNWRFKGSAAAAEAVP